jgi:hypothetical protein
VVRTESKVSSPKVVPPSALRTTARQLHLPGPWKIPLRPTWIYEGALSFVTDICCTIL